MKSNKNWKVSAVLFLLSQNISLFGSSIVGYAVIWHITLETSSGFWMMMATIFSNLPQIIISLWGGALADRFNRKYMIMAADGSIVGCFSNSFDGGRHSISGSQCYLSANSAKRKFD